MGLLPSIRWPNCYRKNVEVGTQDGDGNGNHRKCQGCHPANLNHETKGPPRCGFFSHAITIFSPARRKHEQGHGLAPSYVVDRKCFKKLLRPNFLRQLSEFQWRKLRRKSCVPFGLETVARTDVSSANVNNSSNTIPLTQTQFTFFPMNRWLESWCY